MSSLANFQRTWRMRNNGKTAWPQGTRLVWIGGVKMTANPSIELEITSAGVQVGQELDVSVDFVVPERNGRYISYLRMALPNGQKFGQRLWVLINVDGSLKKPMHEVRPGFNLNLPPGSEDVTPPEVDAPIPEPTVGQSLPEPNTSNASIKTVDAPILEPMMDQNLPELDMSNDNAFVKAVDAPIPELTVDQSLSENVDAQTKEETVHNELREMGFNHASLNKEILKTNDYDLEQTIVDICGDSGWDTILEELEEMGFNDEDIKKRLLRKNGHGSY